MESLKRILEGVFITLGMTAAGAITLHILGISLSWSIVAGLIATAYLGGRAREALNHS